MMSIIDMVPEEVVRNGERKEFFGLDSTSQIIYYKLWLNQMTIGSIDLGEQFIWVTFDHRVKRDILGTDLLNKLCRVYVPELDAQILSNNTVEIWKYLGVILGENK